MALAGLAGAGPAVLVADAPSAALGAAAGVPVPRARGRGPPRDSGSHASHALGYHLSCQDLYQLVVVDQHIYHGFNVRQANPDFISTKVNWQ